MDLVRRSNPEFETTWSCNYQARILPGLPGTGPEAHQFTATSQGVGREGLVVQINCGGRSWTGNFQRGDGKLSGIYATPSADHLCVIAAGRGYWVLSRDPSSYEVVRVYPIQDVKTVPEFDLLVFVDYTNLAGYGPTGLRWKSERVSWDGIEILEANTKGIVGRAWDASTETQVGFYIDPSTGQLEGGAAPPENDVGDWSP